MGEIMTGWHEIIGRVSFVNCDPLFHEIPEPWKILPAPPAWLTGHLLRKDCLIAPIPTADFAKHSDQLQLIPGLGIASVGSVGSVLLFGDRDPGQMRDVALPTDSATSRKLLMWLLHEIHMDPRPVEMGPDLNRMLGRCDGALLIGDRAMDEAVRHPELVRMDLGQAWYDHTNYPMVFAVFAAHQDAPIDSINEAVDMMYAQLNKFESDQEYREDVISATSERSGFNVDSISRYFDDVIHRLDDDAMNGLHYFINEVCGIESYVVLTND
jgi:chorismate dehydratase